MRWRARAGRAMAESRAIIAFATQGADSSDEQRLLELLSDHSVVRFPFDRAHKLRSGLRLVSCVRRTRPALVAMEGTGLAGGIAVLASRTFAGVPYIVSSGDAVGPFVGSLRKGLALP